MNSNALRLVERVGRILVCGLVALVSLAGCRHPKSAESDDNHPVSNPVADGVAPLQFDEVAAPAGVVFTYYNGDEADECAIIESLGGGVAALDFDLDGWQDLCYPGGGKFAGNKQFKPLPTGLFRNLGDWKFESVGQSARIERPRHYSHGATVGDFNDDGFPDVLITGFGGVQLWENQGDGTFSEVQDAAGLDDRRWSSSAAWGDLNGDGWLDLYVVHYVNWSFENHPYLIEPSNGKREVGSPKDFGSVPDVLYFSNGDGTFRDVTEPAGLRDDGDAKGLGVLLCDVDNDGDLDIYVCNDGTPNFMYLNQGDGVFREVGTAQGVACDDNGIPNGSMGVDVCDFNGDGLPDLWVANFEQESFALYRNEGPNGFLHVSQPMGVTALGGLFVGFGTRFADFDHDGDEDVIVANGHVNKYPRASPRRQLPVALLHDENGRFTRASFPESSYFVTPQEGRGVAAADLDHDGDLDVSISHLNEPVALLKNQTPRHADSLSVRLIGVASDRDAIGARLVLHTSSGDQSRFVVGGGSYLSQSDLRVHWGVPQGARIKGLTVYWPSGLMEEVSIPTAAQRLTCLEGGGSFVSP